MELAWTPQSLEDRRTIYDYIADKKWYGRTRTR